MTAKDLIRSIVGRIGASGGAGYAIEFGGSTIRDLSMEGRMTLCNMAIEAGARVGLVAVDQTTIDYVKGRPLPGYRLHVGLESQTIAAPGDWIIPFEMDGFRQHCLLHGLDDISLTFEHADKVRAYEQERQRAEPWLFTNRRSPL